MESACLKRRFLKKKNDYCEYKNKGCIEHIQKKCSVSCDGIDLELRMGGLG
ncbi:hypothetical protein PULV_a0903 [Pseudoalteromonas ulvae UL12]|nr:hypothetical protein [Pseudoalteromonas ulvae UL12]